MVCYGSVYSIFNLANQFHGGYFRLAVIGLWFAVSVFQVFQFLELSSSLDLQHQRVHVARLRHQYGSGLLHDCCSALSQPSSEHASHHNFLPVHPVFNRGAERMGGGYFGGFSCAVAAAELVRGIG